MTGKISPRACGRRSDADNAPKAACAGDRGFETGQKTGAILQNSRLDDSSKAARRHPLNRGREKTRVMVGSWRMKAHNWQPSGESRLLIIWAHVCPKLGAFVPKVEEQRCLEFFV
jgi:hypothetical protein